MMNPVPHLPKRHDESGASSARAFNEMIEFLLPTHDESGALSGRSTGMIRDPVLGRLRLWIRELGLTP
jgi:hypothetical protein